MRKAIHRLSAFLALLAAGCVLVMMLMTTVDVSIRWMTGRSLPGAQEVTESLMVAIVYLGIAYALYRREHVAVAVLTTRLSPRPAAALRLIGQLIMFALVAWITWRTGQEAWRSYVNGEVRFGLLQIPIWPARMTIPIGLAAFLLQAALDLIDQVNHFRAGTSSDDDAAIEQSFI